MMAPSGTFCPLLNATRILPSAMAHVDISSTSGLAPRTGTAMAMGLAESRRSMPPVGATRMPPPEVLTKQSEIMPAAAAWAAQAPTRPT